MATAIKRSDKVVGIMYLVFQSYRDVPGRWGFTICVYCNRINAEIATVENKMIERSLAAARRYNTWDKALFRK